MADQQKITKNELEAKLVAQAWKDEAFKQELINNPKAVLEREIGQKIPENADIRVLEETANTVYLVIPKKPTVDELSEEQLEAVAGGGSGIVPDEVSFVIPLSINIGYDT
jgi:hypothetical protein